MNRVLASTLDLLNGLIAITVIIVAAILGHRFMLGGGLIGTLTGAFVGLVIASLVCGTIAYLALIERHLARLAGGRSTGADAPVQRREPTL